MTIKPLALAAALMASASAPAFAQSQTAPATPSPAAAAANEPSGTYVFDPDHSHILYTYDHLGFSDSTGIIRSVQGTITVDAANLANSTVEASFPLSSLLTVSPNLDGHMMGDDLFKGAAPDTMITFKSTSVVPDGDDEADVTGDLTLNGVTKPVTLEVDLKKAGEQPMTKKPAIGLEAEGKIKRSDFNLGAFAPAVGDEVELKIIVEAQKG